MDPDKSVVFAYDGLPAHLDLAIPALYVHSLCFPLIKMQKIVIESDLCANVRIFALMNVSSHYRSPFHANDCVFSRNEQQKV